MAIVVFVTKLFCRVDDPMKDIPNHLPGITVAERAGHYIGLLYAIIGYRKEALLPVAPRQLPRHVSFAA